MTGSRFVWLVNRKRVLRPRIPRNLQRTNRRLHIDVSKTRNLFLALKV